MPKLLTVIVVLSSLPTVMAQAEVDFAHDVVPILRQHCAECHTGEHAEGGFQFNTQRQLLESGYVEPGLPADSRMIELVHSKDEDDQMPPSDRQRVSAAEIEVLERWITAGAEWEPGFRFAKAAWEPPLEPRHVEVPVIDAAGPHPIDRLLAVYYRDQALTPPAEVSAAVWLRRVYMDLIGLPPTLEEQHDFLTQPYNTATRRQLVSDLLERNHDYTDHWISFWNDLLRNDYVGTGYIDGGRSQITAWLYEALLTNTPYDEFVRQLISPTKASEGFIKGIKWRGNVNASQVREVQFAQNVSQVFLGINMKCASCHDSFIDHWTLDEAYGLAAIYSQRKLDIHRCDKPTGRIASPAWIFPQLGDVDATADQPTRLKQLAQLMTSPKNGRFSRTIANRIWHRLMGRGIVHPVDAMHTEPWNADLLDFLANHLVDEDYDLKSLIQLIAESRAYRSEARLAEDPAAASDTFQGPVRRHLTAEQFMDAVWRLAGTGPQRIDAPLPDKLRREGGLPQVAKAGQWIWTYADTRTSPPGEIAWFRRALPLESRPKRTTLVITCDNEYSVFVNRKKVGSDGDWGTVEAINITRHLRRGDNEILVMGKNGGSSANAASLYAEIIMEGRRPEPVHVGTDSAWQATRDMVDPRQSADAQWVDATIVPPQFTPGKRAEDAIGRTIGRVLNLSSHISRAALLKSNLLMRSLGRPNREQVVTVRPESLSTLQAIDLANGEMLDRMLRNGAEQLVGTVADPAQLVDTLFRRALVRPPTETERDVAIALLGTAEIESLQDLLWLLVMHPEFQFVH